MTAADLRAEILASVARFHASAFPDRAYTPGETPVPCAGRVFDGDALVDLVNEWLDF
jgi:CDP-6-deoxy-D-xylo-4-hexulose-3-dehydrase